MKRDRRTALPSGGRLKQLRGYLVVELPPVPGVLVPDVLPDVPPDAPPELEPDLLKWASHSWREIWPSPFVSTDEKLGALVLLEAPEALEESDDPLEVVPDADGEEAAGAGEDGLLDDDEEDCATANVESANRTAAVVTPRALGMDLLSGWVRGGNCKQRCASAMPAVASARVH